MTKDLRHDDLSRTILTDLVNKYFGGNPEDMKVWMAKTKGPDGKSMVTVLTTAGIDALVGQIALLRANKELEITAP